MFCRNIDVVIILNYTRKQVSNVYDILWLQNAIFSKISNSVININESTSLQDAEIDAIVNARLQNYDEQTTLQAKEDSSSLFDLD